eukprot:PhM_4_TR13192/c0_g1_i1/m.24805
MDLVRCVGVEVAQNSAVLSDHVELCFGDGLVVDVLTHNAGLHAGRGLRGPVALPRQVRVVLTDVLHMHVERGDRLDSVLRAEGTPDPIRVEHRDLHAVQLVRGQVRDGVKRGVASLEVELGELRLKTPFAEGTDTDNVLGHLCGGESVVHAECELLVREAADELRVLVPADLYERLTNRDGRHDGRERREHKLFTPATPAELLVVKRAHVGAQVHPGLQVAFAEVCIGGLLLGKHSAAGHEPHEEALVKGLHLVACVVLALPFDVQNVFGSAHELQLAGLARAELLWATPRAPLVLAAGLDGDEVACVGLQLVENVRQLR